MTTPPPSPVSSAFTQAMTSGIKLNIQGTLPGEAVLTALIGYATAVRATMDHDLMMRLDAIIVQQLEDIQKLWRSIWIQLGVVK